jgi:hypothetical protein
LDDAVFVPRAGAVRIAIERDLSTPRNPFELVDDLTAHGTQIRGLPIDRDACPFAFAREVEEIADDVLDAMHAAFDDVRVLLGRAGRVSDVLKAAGSKQDRAKRIADVVTHDGENPFLEVLSQRQLLLVVSLLRLMRPTTVVDIDTSADVPSELSGIV